MRHQVGTKKLGRTTAHKIALLRNLATELFRHERINTTEPKAKVLRSFAEKLITLGKRGDLHARRQAARDVRDHAVLQKLFAEIGPRFSARAGGYTRVLKTGFRRGDNAATAMIELVDYKPVAKVVTPAPEKKIKLKAPVQAPAEGEASDAEVAEKPAKAPKKAKAPKAEKKAAAPKAVKAPKAKKADDAKPAKKKAPAKKK
jgi:large subunit ribosomal protein L17